MVWGELAKEKSRDALVARMAALGWTVADRAAGEIRFRGDHAWKGTATFHDDGTFTFTRPVVGLQSRPVSEYTPPPVGGPILPEQNTMAVGAGPTVWLLPSARKLDGARSELVDGTHDQVSAYLAVSHRTELENELLLLPDQLDRLWADGIPLVPTAPPLATPEARRRAVLEFWASRADSEEGARVDEAVETWLAAVVQPSDHPITDAERAEFSARRPDRTLP